MTQANGWFFNKAKQDHVASKEKGRAIFKDVIMVEITIPGDKASKVVQRVSDAEDDPNKLRFPSAWEAFQNATKQVGEGMPLEEWPMMTAGRVMELKSLNIHTVEQLADLNESFIAKLGPNGRETMEQAKAYLDTAEKGPGQAAQEISQLSTENAALKTRAETAEGKVTELEAEAKTLKARVTELENAETDTSAVDSLQASLNEMTSERDGLAAKVSELEAEAAKPTEETPNADAATVTETSKSKAATEDKDAEEKANIRAQIEAKTGEKVKGNPSLKTLQTMLKDA